jgi:hypothetical protein
MRSQCKSQLVHDNSTVTGVCSELGTGEDGYPGTRIHIKQKELGACAGKAVEPTDH